MTDSTKDTVPARDSVDLALGRPGEPFPANRLEALLNLRYGRDAAGFLDCLLSRPLSDLLGRSGKRIRGRLVELGAALAGGAPSPELHRLVDAIEALHVGSLAIDDLQDGSRVRRGAPALHVKYGVPIAVNVGNLLYFWPAEIIASLGLPPAVELRLLRVYHRTLVRAHLGQVMDVGIPIDTVSQDRVHDVCLSSMELKSGALFSLSLLFGAILAGANDELEAAIDEFGHGLGIGLQMFDDIGNVRGAAEPAKRREDLLLRRPTWIWACAARHFSRDAYAAFVSSVHQLSTGDSAPLETWFDGNDFIRRAGRLAQDHVERSFRRLEENSAGKDAAAVRALRALAADIARAYD